MKKVQINVEYQNKVFSSKIEEMSGEDIETTIKFLGQISKGEVSYLSFEVDGTHYFFTKNILENSIISLVVT
jgi:hypothetical protein